MSLLIFAKGVSRSINQKYSHKLPGRPVTLLRIYKTLSRNSRESVKKEGFRN